MPTGQMMRVIDNFEGLSHSQYGCAAGRYSRCTNRKAVESDNYDGKHPEEKFLSPTWNFIRTGTWKMLDSSAITNSRRTGCQFTGDWDCSACLLLRPVAVAFVPAEVGTGLCPSSLAKINPLSWSRKVVTFVKRTLNLWIPVALPTCLLMLG